MSPTLLRCAVVGSRVEPQTCKSLFLGGSARRVPVCSEGALLVRSSRYPDADGANSSVTFRLAVRIVTNERYGIFDLSQVREGVLVVPKGYISNNHTTTLLSKVLDSG